MVELGTRPGGSRMAGAAIRRGSDMSSGFTRGQGAVVALGAASGDARVIHRGVGPTGRSMAITTVGRYRHMIAGFATRGGAVMT